ncbi:hypothetical protein AVEN_183352-1, partial [Araneus ventricosus]
GKGTAELQAVRDMPVVTTEKCRRAYRRLGGSRLPRGINNGFICAGPEDGSKDACQLPPNTKSTGTETCVAPLDQFLHTGVEEIRRLRAEPGLGKLTSGLQTFQVLEHMVAEFGLVWVYWCKSQYTGYTAPNKSLLSFKRLIKHAQGKMIQCTHKVN